MAQLGLLCFSEATDVQTDDAKKPHKDFGLRPTIVQNKIKPKTTQVWQCYVPGPPLFFFCFNYPKTQKYTALQQYHHVKLT